MNAGRDADRDEEEDNDADADVEELVSGGAGDAMGSREGTRAHEK